MDASQFLSVFGVDMGKGSRVIAHRKNLMEDALVKNVKKREALRCQIITILIELWRFNALPRDSIDKMARTTEFILKSMVQHAVLPNFDWKRTVSDAFEKVCKPSRGVSRKGDRSRTPRHHSFKANMVRDSDARETLPRRRDVSAARSKPAAKPGDRFASTNVALNTNQRQ